MDRDTALEKIKECVNNDDPETAHEAADTVLCDLLRALGYGDVVDAYLDVEKWYA